MSAWWWLAVAFAGWLLISVGFALIVGRIIRIVDRQDGQ